MIVFCEDCGRRYRITTEDMESDEITFPCETCAHLITVRRVDPKAGQPTGKGDSKSGI